MIRLDKNLLEWLVFAVALVLVLATLGYLVRESLESDGGPPDVVVTLGEPRPGAAGHMVPLTIENRGNGTAEEVRVTVRLDHEVASEEAVLVIAYLPRKSSRSGWVTLRADPREGTLRVAGVAYQEP